MLLLHEERDDLRVGLEASVLSRVYGQQEPATRFRLRRLGKGAQIVTVAHAFDESEAPPVSLDVRGTDPAEIRLRLPSRALLLRLTKDNHWLIGPAP